MQLMKIRGGGTLNFSAGKPRCLYLQGNKSKLIFDKMSKKYAEVFPI